VREFSGEELITHFRTLCRLFADPEDMLEGRRPIWLRRALISSRPAPIYGWFTEGFDTLNLKEAKALPDPLPRLGRRQ
jgi:hypothetical protein